MGKTATILALGDVIGQSGFRAVVTSLSGIRKRHGADAVVLNVENSAEGFGVTEELAGKLLDAGADVLTTGNHVWQKKEVRDYLDRQDYILRPANYPGGAPGHGSCVFEHRGLVLGVVNLQGRRRMPQTDCPFRLGREIARKMRSRTRCILVDFHAEATDEKEALGLYLDGEVSAVVGTHTHIQTADERILPNGTAYITDIGASGPVESVIGFQPDISIQRSLTQLPLRNEVSDNRAAIHGVKIEIDTETGRATSITRIREESLV